VLAAIRKSVETFDTIEDAINFLHEQGYCRLEAEEEKSMLTVMNGGENKRGWQVPGTLAEAVFARPVTTKDCSLPSVSTGGNELAAAILETVQALAEKRKLPQILTLSKLPSEYHVPVRFPIGALDSSLEDHSQAFTYFDGAINWLTEKGYRRLESAQ